MAWRLGLGLGGASLVSAADSVAGPPRSSARPRLRARTSRTGALAPRTRTASTAHKHIPCCRYRPMLHVQHSTGCTLDLPSSSISYRTLYGHVAPLKRAEAQVRTWSCSTQIIHVSYTRNNPRPRYMWGNGSVRRCAHHARAMSLRKLVSSSCSTVSRWLTRGPASGGGGERCDHFTRSGVGVGWQAPCGFLPGLEQAAELLKDDKRDHVVRPAKKDREEGGVGRSPPGREA